MHKTAYEMRIRDWSSDVCSSDLANMSRDNAIVMRYDNPDIPSGRDIVYLHGRGSTEREAGCALPLFGRANVRSYRGPLIQAVCFAWFQNAFVCISLPVTLSPYTAHVSLWISADPFLLRPSLSSFCFFPSFPSPLFFVSPPSFSFLFFFSFFFSLF